VHRLVQSKYVVETYVRGDTANSNVLVDLSVNVDELFDASQRG
jgi:hypothetical protein